MTKYLVEARLTYEVAAAAVDDALRLVSASVQDRNAVDIEYRVLQRREQAPRVEPRPDDYQGLDKPAYTVAEVSSMLRTSRSAIYEMVRRGVKCIRMGRRMLLPRSTVLAILNGEARFDDPEVRPQPPPARIRVKRDGESSRAKRSFLIDACTQGHNGLRPKTPYPSPKQHGHCGFRCLSSDS